MSIWPFHFSKTILISYTHRNVMEFTATRQNKSSVSLEDIRLKYITIVRWNVRYRLLLLKLLKPLFLRNNHTMSLMFNCNIKSPLFSKKQDLFNFHSLKDQLNDLCWKKMEPHPNFYYKIIICRPKIFYSIAIILSYKNTHFTLYLDF